MHGHVCARLDSERAYVCSCACTWECISMHMVFCVHLLVCVRVRAPVCACECLIVQSCVCVCHGAQVSTFIWMHVCRGGQNCIYTPYMTV
jgi:hypothetical protein